jgi:hypothetical protein
VILRNDSFTGRCACAAAPITTRLLLALALLAGLGLSCQSGAVTPMGPLAAGSGFWSFLSGRDDPPAYDSIAILQPKADQTIFDNSGKLDVDVRLDPPLAKDSADRIVLIIDGQRIADQRQAHFELGAIDRGTHTLQAMVITTKGRTLIASPPQQFTMWQASALFPERHRH